MPPSFDRRPRVDVEFASPIDGKSVKVSAVADTGAMVTCVPDTVLASLGPDLDWEFVEVRGPVGETQQVCRVTLTLRVAGREFQNVSCIVTNRNHALLGWDVLSDAKTLVAAAGSLFSDLALMLEHVSVFKEKFVLVLGQDSTEVARLRAIQSSLESHGYSGIVMKDLAETKIQCLEEKVNMLGSLSRFVVCENTTPSGHIAELQICTRNRFVTAILQQAGHRATLMQADYGLDFSFVETFEYTDMPGIQDCVDRAVKWANGKLAERTKYLESLYRIRSKRGPRKGNGDTT